MGDAGCFELMYKMLSRIFFAVAVVFVVVGIVVICGFVV